MQSSSNHSLGRLKEKGLTLVEVLVVAPMIILIIGTVIVAIVALTGESLVRRETNAVVFNVQSALDDMEGDAQKATSFLYTTGTLTTPQGKGNSTSAFLNNTSGQPDTLIIRSTATTTNPFDPNRQIVYTTAPNTCGTPDESKNPPVAFTIIYFVDSGTLWKRTIVPTSGNCSSPWQRNSCAAGQTTGACSGVLQDEKVLSNVTAMNITYYTNPGPTGTVVADNSSPSASTMEVSITVDTSIAGKAINYQAKTRATSVNITGT
ncbi:MAG TPA: prepilin-type N-terminal cleavage/methylation domain-containing protein [Candidatus Saccharimonadales bacterium]